MYKRQLLSLALYSAYGIIFPALSLQTLWRPKSNLIMVTILLLTYSADSDILTMINFHKQSFAIELGGNSCLLYTSSGSLEPQNAKDLYYMLSFVP